MYTCRCAKNERSVMDEVRIPRYTGNDFADMSKSDGGLVHAVGTKNYQVMRASRAHPELSDGYGHTYNHAPDMTYWHGRFWLEYLSSPVDEHEAPGVSHLVSSTDGIHWSFPVDSFPPLKLPSTENICSSGKRVVIPDNTYAVMHQRMGFFISSKDRLLVSGFYGYSPDHAVPWADNGIGRVVREIYDDGSMGDIYFIRLLEKSGWKEDMLPFRKFSACSDPGFVEACNELLENRLVVQQWAEEHGNDDELVYLKTHNEAEGFHADKPYQAFTWYHIDDNTIVGLWKQSIVGISHDNGDTWTISKEMSFATSGAKAWGEHTSDGKFSIVYINSLSSEHRYPMVIVSGTDGIDFSEMACVFGETPPRRYEGLFKDFGPQYIRGICENCGKRADDDIWICHSVNKEDIWVTRIPVPVKRHSLIDGDVCIDSDLSAWNIYSGKLAYAEYDNGSILMADSDPVDGAIAELNFRDSEYCNIDIHLRCCVSKHDFYIDLSDNHGYRCARLIVRNGMVYGRYTSVEQFLFPLGDDGTLACTLVQDCLKCDLLVFKGDRQISRLRNMQKINSVSRLTFRTKDRFAAPGVDVRPLDKDLPGSDNRTEKRIYRIDAVTIR